MREDRDDDGAGAALALGLLIRVGEDLEDEVTAPAGSLGVAEPVADLGKVLDIEIRAPVVGGDGPGGAIGLVTILGWGPCRTGFSSSMSWGPLWQRASVSGVAWALPREPNR